MNVRSAAGKIDDIVAMKRDQWIIKVITHHLPEDGGRDLNPPLSIAKR